MSSYTNLDSNFENLWFRLFVKIKTVRKIKAKSSLSRQCQNGTFNDHLSQFGVIVGCLYES